MNLTGILFGVVTIVVVGLGFVWVIKLEYYVGAHVAEAVGALGLAMIVASLFVTAFRASGVLGVLGASAVWGAVELPQQERRVAKGMFPANPRKRTGSPRLGDEKGGGL
jgi:hypothetical protein